MEIRFLHNEASWNIEFWNSIKSIWTQLNPIESNSIQSNSILSNPINSIALNCLRIRSLAYFIILILNKTKFEFITGVVNVLSNIENIFFEQKYSTLETSGSTNLNQETLTTPKQQKGIFSLFLEQTRLMWKNPSKMPRLTKRSISIRECEALAEHWLERLSSTCVSTRKIARKMTLIIAFWHS